MILKDAQNQWHQQVFLLGHNQNQNLQDLTKLLPYDDVLDLVFKREMEDLYKRFLVRDEEWKWFQSFTRFVSPSPT